MVGRVSEFVVTTERLQLREAGQADAPFFVHLLNEKGWQQNIGDPGVRNETDAEAYINSRLVQSYVTHGFGLWLVLREGLPVGVCGLIKRDFLDDVDIGFGFLESTWGKGYASEAAMAVMRLCSERFGLFRLAAIVLPTNAASIAVLTRLDMIYVRNINFPGTGELLHLYERALV